MFIQGGDISKVYSTNTGKRDEAGYSAFGGEFADESFHVKHTEPGLLGMSKRSGTPNSNEC